MLAGLIRCGSDVLPRYPAVVSVGHLGGPACRASFLWAELEPVPLRHAWPDEATNFTPWLAEEVNLAHLGETLGLDLQLEAVEKQVGPFAADVLAKELDTQRLVLIENQIAPTDHRHLGQLLTYAAGLDARTIVWIAESFRDEHRAAVEFLNRATAEQYAFSVQVELYRIGNSTLAPRFSIVAQPNNWNRQVQAAKKANEGEINDTQKLSLEYWGELIKAASGQYPALAQRERVQRKLAEIRETAGRRSRLRA